MNYEKWLEIVQSENFWGGVFASILAAVIVGIVLYVFRNTIKFTVESKKRREAQRKTFEAALEGSSTHAPFAYGVAQAIALRHFVVAVFIAYIGDIMGIFWPINIAFYALALVFVWFSLKWFFKIEKSALKSFEKIR